jgi:hypothetical protein
MNLTTNVIDYKKLLLIVQELGLFFIGAGPNSSFFKYADTYNTIKGKALD